MKPIYISGSSSISIQPTFRDGFFFDEIIKYDENGIKIIDPDYKEFIPALQLRRMGKSMRMAVYSSQKAIQKAGNPTIEAVISGTGEGCLHDSEKFVEALWANDGGMLNPTPFIQSTHNMAAATVALALGCKGYNMTFTNNSNSFESALMDAQLYLNENPSQTILVGGLDEIGERTTQFWREFGYLTTENPQIPLDFDFDSRGEVVSEGAGFFVVSGAQSENCLGKVSAVQTQFEVESPERFITTFLSENQLDIKEIDGVILGMNGDNRYDPIYTSVMESIFQNTPQILYKNIFGEFDTVSALAVEVGLTLFHYQKIPAILHHNSIEKGAYNSLLIYNQRRGQNHGLILLQK